VRPWTHASFDDPKWEAVLRGWDCEATSAPLDVRHPYLDLRVLRYMLAVPTLPWCRSKYLLRRAMRGRLPEAVLRRRKLPLASDTLWEATRGSSIDPLDPAPGIDRYVDIPSVPILGRDRARFRTDSRPYKLNYWMRQTQSATTTGETDERFGQAAT
jgi:asparagine synthase (glutamine-hydrolysing)